MTIYGYERTSAQGHSPPWRPHGRRADGSRRAVIPPTGSSCVALIPNTIADIVQTDLIAYVVSRVGVTEGKNGQGHRQRSKEHALLLFLREESA